MMLKQNQDLFYERLLLIRKQVDKKPELNETRKSATKKENIISEVVKSFNDYGLQ